MTDPNKDLDDRLKKLAEDTIDRLNADALDTGAPVMLTSYVFIVEGNGWDDHGDPVSRGVTVSQGSSSQVKGLLVDSLDYERDREK
jgi:hypothetical protein